MSKAGLFSAVIVVSFVESYKWLSPDPVDETVKLLTLISRHLSTPPMGYPSRAQLRAPTTSAMLVNLAWFSSMALCFSYSTFATLVQQWA
ncbi:hypothetical protein H4582DRAFT_1825125 [Lactarius indigo]|nr:hypothetical protein H4582DRAFT_1825125 [Lactarius indigo]